MRKKQICFFEKSQYDKLSDGLAASESEFSAPRPPPNDGMSLALVIIVSIRPLYINQFRLHGALLLFLVTGAGADTVTLSWNANSEPDLAGYRIHYGTAAAPFGQLVDVPVATATVPNLLKGVTYTFAVTAYNTAGAESAYSAPLSYTPGSARVIPSAVLANISTRTLVQTGESVMIGGFIIDGIVPKKVAVRAIGPSLANAGITGALSDPSLQVVDSTGAVVASNDSWNIPGEELSAYGLAPADAREAGVVTSLTPGAYSAIVSGKGTATGIALFELYDLDIATGRVANISTRSRVDAGDGVMIGGFILGGETASEVIVRALGPSLVSAGVTGTLLDPTLELYDSNGVLFAADDNWRTNQEAAIIATTLPPADDRESAIILTLPAGAYSAVIRGANDTTGIALFEVYALNQ